MRNVRKGIYLIVKGRGTSRRLRTMKPESELGEGLSGVNLCRNFQYLFLPSKAAHPSFLAAVAGVVAPRRCHASAVTSKPSP